MEKTKPDLMAAIGTQRPGGGKRILAQLEHGPRPPALAARAAGWTIDGWTIGLFALLLLMCGVAWLMHGRTITPKTYRHDYGSGQSPGLALRRAAESTPAPAQPATIVNEAAPRPGADGETPVAVHGESGAAAAAPARSAHTAAPAPRPAAARTAMVPSAPGARAANAAPPAATAAASDTDVTLLTALMAHTGKPAAVTPERPRDVVERQEGDSTARLLARCKQLGLIEGMLCRSRICSGRWENDAACRAPAH